MRRMQHPLHTIDNDPQNHVSNMRKKANTTPIDKYLNPYCLIYIMECATILSDELRRATSLLPVAPVFTNIGG